MNLVGKRLGYMVIVEEGDPGPEEPRRAKYGKRWYRIQCDCGVSKWMPRPGIANCRSCGCHKNDHLKVGLVEAIRYTPDHPTMGTTRTEVYTDL